MSFASIDLGTGLTKAAMPDGQGNPILVTNRQGEASTRSDIFLDKDRVIVGAEATNAGFMDPSRYISGWKRSMGTDSVLAKGPDGREWRARDVATVLLGETKQDYEQKTSQPLGEVIATIPANYNEKQRDEMLQAAAAAGLKVICMAHEPVAAAFGNAVHKSGDGLVLVLDLGHGTFDVSILEVCGNSVNTKATNGVPQLGGMDFGLRIQGFMLERFAKEHGLNPTAQSHPLAMQELFGRVEQAKLSLSQREQVAIVFSCDGKLVTVQLTRKQFEQLCRDLIDKAMACAQQTLKDAGLTPQQIRMILPVGGAARMPMFTEAIEKYFGHKCSPTIEANFAAAYGGVILGRVEMERQNRSVVVGGRALPPLSLFHRDVTAHALGVATLDDQQRLINTVILPKGLPIPSDKTAPFRLADPNQTEAGIQILEGPEGTPSEQCLQLGHFDLKNLTPVTNGLHRIEIRMKIDRNGMLSATAYDPHSGISSDLVIDYRNHKPPAAPKP